MVVKKQSTKVMVAVVVLLIKEGTYVCTLYLTLNHRLSIFHYPPSISCSPLHILPCFITSLFERVIS